MLGNIGVPICDASMETKPGDIIVAEVAALQLETIRDFPAPGGGASERDRGPYGPVWNHGVLYSLQDAGYLKTRRRETSRF